MEEQVKEERSRSRCSPASRASCKRTASANTSFRRRSGCCLRTRRRSCKRISGGRYSLSPAGDEFKVVDHHNADERRSVKTLSGGETFLASLALALALSRHVGELASEGMGAKLESVFIDEGFGTLDPATLDEVIDALERLRADGPRGRGHQPRTRAGAADPEWAHRPRSRRSQPDRAYRGGLTQTRSRTPGR